MTYFVEYLASPGSPKPVWRWSLEMDGETLHTERTYDDDGLSYVDRVTEAGSDVEILQISEDYLSDGSLQRRSVQGDDGGLMRTWVATDFGWKLLAEWSDGASTVFEEVEYRFDAEGREVDRLLLGEAPSPYIRRVRTSTCEHDGQAEVALPALPEPFIDYVSPLLVDPPPLASR